MPGRLPYGRHSISDDDIAAVVDVLRGDWLTTGPLVDEFEREFANYCGTASAVAVSSGTAALHAMMHVLDIQPGDEVIVPAMTFAATANCVVYQGGTPVFVDVERDTLLLDPVCVEAAITDRTRAIIAVDYAGQPCDYQKLQGIADRYGLTLVSDCCHSLGAALHGRAVGSLTRMSAFSFHPVKPITTGEGGMVTTDDTELAARMKVFRNHGINSDHRQREACGSWHYEMQVLGFNYRLNDLQCALGLSQLKKLGGWIARRQAIAHEYNEAFAGLPGVEPLGVRPAVSHGYHLYVVRWLGNRADAFQQLRAAGLGVNVHYSPVHLHPFYRQRLGTGPGMCPVAEQSYEQIISLPIHPGMTDQDIQRVVHSVASESLSSSNQAA